MTGINFKPLDEATFNNFKDRTVRNKNTQYWIDRNFRAVKEGEKKADEFLRDMQKVYEKSLADLQKEIEAFYGRYATENGLTLAEVNKRLDPKQLKSAIEEIKRYYEFADPAKIGADMSREYRDELRRLSARAYMSRLEEIKARLKHEMVKLAAEQEAAMTETLKEVYEEAHSETSYNIDYERGFTEGYSAPNNDVLEKVVKEKWLEDNYSSRVWKDKGRLLTSIETELLSGIAQGHNPKKIAEAMAEKYSQNYKNCERVARTETIHTMNVATSNAYKAHGIEKYEFVCDLSERTCVKCGALDGTVHDLKYKQEGVNYPVMHPNCRCTTIPYFEKDEIDAMFDEDTRIAYDENHKRYEVPASMTYRQWKEACKTGKIAESKEILQKRETTPKEDISNLQKKIKEKNELTEKQIKNAVLPNQKQFNNMIDDIFNGNYRNLPSAIKLPPLKKELTEKLGITDNFYLTQQRMKHINPKRKASHSNQDFRREEYKNILKMIETANSAYIDTEKGNFLIANKDSQNERKVNIICFNKDKFGNYIVTIKNVDSGDLKKKELKKVEVGVSPTITRQNASPASKDILVSPQVKE